MDKSGKTINWGGGGRDAGRKPIYGGDKLVRVRYGLESSQYSYLRKLQVPRVEGERKGAGSALRFVLRWYRKNKTAVSRRWRSQDKPGDSEAHKNWRWRAYHISEELKTFVADEAVAANITRTELVRRAIAAFQHHTQDGCDFCQRLTKTCLCGRAAIDI